VVELEELSNSNAGADGEDEFVLLIGFDICSVGRMEEPNSRLASMACVG
jgi:hypothetical protein